MTWFIKPSLKYVRFLLFTAELLFIANKLQIMNPKIHNTMDCIIYDQPPTHLGAFSHSILILFCEAFCVIVSFLDKSIR